MTHGEYRGSEMALRTGVALSTLSLYELWAQLRSRRGQPAPERNSPLLWSACCRSVLVITTRWPRCSTITSLSTIREWAIAWPTLTNSDQDLSPLGARLLVPQAGATSPAPQCQPKLGT
jgi:hypothetical protein